MNPIRTKRKAHEVGTKAQIVGAITGGEEDVRRGFVLTHEDAKDRTSASREARQRRRWALHLLAEQDEILDCIENRRWGHLRALVDFVSRGLPLSLEKHDPALFELLFRQIAQLNNSGRYAQALEALVQQNHDAMAGALLRGLHARRKLALAEGGSMPVAQAAKALGISEETVLRRIENYELLAWRNWRQERLTYRIPVWQFAGRRLLPGMKRILRQFNLWHRFLDLRDDWGIMLFFLASRISLGGGRVLDLLRIGEVDKALSYLEDDAPIGEGRDLLQRSGDQKSATTHAQELQEAQPSSDFSALMDGEIKSKHALLNTSTLVKIRKRSRKCAAALRSASR